MCRFVQTGAIDPSYTTLWDLLRINIIIIMSLTVRRSLHSEESSTATTPIISIQSRRTMSHHTPRIHTIMTPLLLVLAVLLPAAATAEVNQDPNVYSFGQNPNLKYHKMYWADSKAVLDDLEEFSALYIKFHSCAWSPNQAFYDDDGEGREYV